MPIEQITNQNTNLELPKNKAAASYTKTEPYPNDSVELSTKKNDKKKSVKNIALGTLGVLTATVGTIILAARFHGNYISKLYKNKLVISNLPEKIEFKEAKTVQEGIDFAKKILGIKEVDKDFTLEAINIANKGLVDVSNANKGKLFMPTRLGFNSPVEKNDDFLAFVIKDITSPNFGNLVINKKYFDEKLLNNEIKDYLYFKDGSRYYKNIDIVNNTYEAGVKFDLRNAVPSFELIKLIDKFYKDPALLSISEKQTLFYSLDLGVARVTRHKRSPYSAITEFSKENSDFLKNNNISIDFDKIKSLTTEKQFEYLKDLVKKLEGKGQYWSMSFGIESPSTVIYHEMGHLQDFAKNLKELDVQRWNLNLKQIWKDAWHKTKTGEDVSRIGVEELDNRWGTVSHERYEKLFNEKPEKFKQLYPDLYEFLTNQEIQQTAGKISSYAQTGIGEFIAEVYKMIIAGKKIPEDIMALYRKYKGPELP